MSDTFDHEGDAWDSYERSLEGDDWEPYYAPTYRDPFCRVCVRCGMPRLKWRVGDDGKWALYENERIEHNRLKPHVCAQDIPTTEGFDDVD